MSVTFPLGPLQAIQATADDKWVMGWLVWLLFAIAGIHVFVTQLEFVFYSAAAFVTVPFATWNRTAWISERTFGAVLSVGVKLMVLYTITSASIPVLKQAVLPITLTQQDSVFMMATGLLLCLLQLAAHRLASGLLHGMPSLTHSDVLPSGRASVALAVGGITMATQALSRAVQRMIQVTHGWKETLNADTAHPWHTARAGRGTGPLRRGGTPPDAGAPAAAVPQQRVTDTLVEGRRDDGCRP